MLLIYSDNYQFNDFLFVYIRFPKEHFGKLYGLVFMSTGFTLSLEYGYIRWAEVSGYTPVGITAALTWGFHKSKHKMDIASQLHSCFPTLVCIHIINPLLLMSMKHSCMVDVMHECTSG